jgi:hypothetical protein
VAYLAAIIGAYFFISITWVFYLAVMNMKQNLHKMRPVVRYCFAYPMAVIGIILDVLFNLAGSIVLLDMPRELLFSTKLERLLHDRKDDWRDVFADKFAELFLDPFDSRGFHIKRPKP